jgi:hypothetical protein
MHVPTCRLNGTIDRLVGAVNPTESPVRPAKQPGAAAAGAGARQPVGGCGLLALYRRFGKEWLMATVFLLSPAYCCGRRAAMMLRPGSQLAIARRLREETLTLAEAFTFMSSLYFRGKIAYARAFAPAVDSTFVITPTRGLQSPETVVTQAVLDEFAAVDIASDDVRYSRPLERDLDALAARLPVDARVVLLGSVATGKYVDVLVPRLGDRLLFPSSFVGRGDMSRGGLLLRHAASGIELDYSVLRPGAMRRGPRPPKLDPDTRVTPQDDRRAVPPAARPSRSTARFSE